MTRDEIRDLVAYSEWATGRLTDAIRALPDRSRRLHDGSAFGSLLGTFTHLVAAEWVWLERWQGRIPPGPPDWVGTASFEEVVAHLRTVERARAAWLDGLTAADLARPMEYRTFAGVASANTIGELVRHLVNHASYHRGQLSMRIRQEGGQPPSTDYIVWLRRPERASRPPAA